MKFTSPGRHNATRILLLGSGELGKEMAIEAQRLGLEVIAVDRYQNAPAHQVAHRAHVVDMMDVDAVLEIIRSERPHYILPEIEAIGIEALFRAEQEGFTVVPSAEAVDKTMNRKHIRRFASEKLGLPTCEYRFVRTLEDLRTAIECIGCPCVVKPVMSSSGHGQSIVHVPEQAEDAWEAARHARGDSSELIVEAFVDFDYEVTLLTLSNGRDIRFCPPIGHQQRDGDYVFSWQPMEMPEKVRQKSERIAEAVAKGLGGRGLFGVELFVKGEEVYFSEVSPRPHDTGMVTLVTQSQSEFALHLRAVLGLNVDFRFHTPGASAAYKALDKSEAPALEIPEDLFDEEGFVRIFGKPASYPGRRMAVVLAMAESADAALKKVRQRVLRIKDWQA